MITTAVVCGCLQSELVNVGVAYCHSVEERCALDLDPGTNYYQAAAVSKGSGMVSPVLLLCLKALTVKSLTLTSSLILFF